MNNPGKIDLIISAIVLVFYAFVYIVFAHSLDLWPWHAQYNINQSVSQPQGTEGTGGTGAWKPVNLNVNTTTLFSPDVITTKPVCLDLQNGEKICK